MKHRSSERAQSSTLRGWRTVKQLVTELQFPSDAACREWLKRQGIVSVRRGRVILVDSLDIDAALRRIHVAKSESKPDQTPVNSVVRTFV